MSVNTVYTRIRSFNLLTKAFRFKSLLMNELQTIVVSHVKILNSINVILADRACRFSEKPIIDASRVKLVKAR